MFLFLTYFLLIKKGAKCPLKLFMLHNVINAFFWHPLVFAEIFLLPLPFLPFGLDM